MVRWRTFSGVSPKISTEDLIDAQGVAEMLGLSHRNIVSLYQTRYPEMPRPVIEFGGGRCRLWSRRAILRWARATGRSSNATQSARRTRSRPD